MRHFSLLLLFLTWTAACGSDSNDNPYAPSESHPEASLNIPFSTTDLRVGTGSAAANGQRLTVAYTGWLYDPNVFPDYKGKVFDSTTAASPFQFTLGNGTVIAGWDQGLVGMRVGGLRRLIIPTELGYGTSGTGPIPGNATLLFEVELLGLD